MEQRSVERSRRHRGGVQRASAQNQRRTCNGCTLDSIVPPACATRCEVWTRNEHISNRCAHVGDARAEDHESILDSTAGRGRGRIESIDAKHIHTSSFQVSKMPARLRCNRVRVVLVAPRRRVLRFRSRDAPSAAATTARSACAAEPAVHTSDARATAAPESVCTRAHTRARPTRSRAHPLPSRSRSPPSAPPPLRSYRERSYDERS